METRTYNQLRIHVENLYTRKDKASLRRCAFMNKKGEIFIYKSTVAEVPIIYGEGTLNEHYIELRVPGRLTYKHRITGEITEDIQRYDIRIRLKNKRMNDYYTPKHSDIVIDLFSKVSFLQEFKQRERAYNAYVTILQNIYHDRYPFEKLPVSEEEKYQKVYNGFSLPEIVTFIKWCTLQEELNYPSNNIYGKDDWGKDLLFARYFEAIYAGLSQDRNSLNDVINRTNNHGKEKPKLFEKERYHGTLAARFG